MFKSIPSSKVNRLLAWGALAGMPLVAAGITLSKLGFSSAFEQVSGIAFAVLAIGVGLQHVRLSIQEKEHPALARRYWLAGAGCLLAGAILASLYALRFSFPIAWVNIPNMKIWHGTLNAAGFGWLTLRGWQTIV